MKPFYLLAVFLVSLYQSLSAQQLPPVIEWQKSLGGSKVDKAGSVIKTSDHGFLVVGLSYSNDGQVTGHHGSTAFSDGWVVKLDANGNIQWQQSYGGSRHDKFIHAIETGNGDFICVGSSESDDGDITGMHMQDTTHKYDMWAVRISKTGAVQWSKVYGGTLDENAQVIRNGVDGGYLIGGDARSNDGDATGNQGNADVWLVKINEAGTIQWQKQFGNPNSQYTTNISILNDGNYLVTGYQRYEGYNPNLGDVYIAFLGLPIKIDPLGNTIWHRITNFPALVRSDGGWFYNILERKPQDLLAVGVYHDNNNEPQAHVWLLDDSTGKQLARTNLDKNNEYYASGLEYQLGPETVHRLSDSSIITCYPTYRFYPTSGQKQGVLTRFTDSSFKISVK